jgi:hypothetical protein
MTCDNCNKPISGKYSIIKDSEGVREDQILCMKCVFVRHIQSRYPIRNLSVFSQIEAIIEKIEYGHIDVTYELHNKGITKVKVYGTETRHYNQ